jgi:hypothetical protein
VRTTRRYIPDDSGLHTADLDLEHAGWIARQNLLFNPLYLGTSCKEHILKIKNYTYIIFCLWFCMGVKLGFDIKGGA